MAVTATPVFPQTPYVVSASLLTTTAFTSRAPQSDGAANMVALTPVSTNGLRIDYLKVVHASTSITSASVAKLVGFWISNGTTATLTDEITVTAVTPSTTVAGFNQLYVFQTPLYLPAAFKTWLTTSVTPTASTDAFTVTAYGAAL